MVSHKQTLRTVPTGLDGSRFDAAAAKLYGITRSQAQKQIKAGRLRVAGETTDAKRPMAAGEVVTQAQLDQTVVETPDLPILYEDDDVIALNKPAGLAVHLSETGQPQSTVAAFGLRHGVNDPDTERPGIVHRLDKDTSGVMLIAKHPAAKAELQRQFKRREVKKTYVALVRGRLNEAEAVIRLPIGRSRKAPTKRAVVPGAREAITHYRVIGEYKGASLVEIDLHTGRTHQIRVHFTHLGHPIIADTLYGESLRPPGLARQFLHASQLSFTGIDGHSHTVTAPLPAELTDYLDGLRV